jgi:hypothetical protein
LQRVAGVVPGVGGGVGGRLESLPHGDDGFVGEA